MRSAPRCRMSSPSVGAPVRLPDGTRVNIRSLIPADLRGGQGFFDRLSDQSRYFRFMTPAPTLGAGVIATLARQARDPRCAVVVAYVRQAGGFEIVGGGRVVPTRRATTCEFALTVIDAWHGRGVGSALLRTLVTRARALGYRHIFGEVLAVNAPMLAVARRLCFSARFVPDDGGVVTVSRALWPSGAAAPLVRTGAPPRPSASSFGAIAWPAAGAAECTASSAMLPAAKWTAYCYRISSTRL